MRKYLMSGLASLTLVAGACGGSGSNPANHS
jgi:hypothetical protein